ncbi:DUF4430 domain-containing protein [Halobacillus sp. A1]|uniref:DUF4430 domain-containing protein n=1 Tax=Halobacillus sp. A1 TaxID=2880262 RepID=UPI0020A6BBCE|nr:DUF4430 domain-containing protein [Halobacillus sp. A1]MCP3032683.1 DUF4430 domain-containing protein [Halobacillus sp. A1]
MEKLYKGLILLMFSTALLVGCQEEATEGADESAAEDTTVEIEISENEGEEVISNEEYTVEEGTVLMEVMEENYEVEQEGGFINSIEGIAPEEDEQKAWIYTINGEDASVGAHEYELEDGDEINFDYQSWE